MNHAWLTTSCVLGRSPGRFRLHPLFPLAGRQPVVDLQRRPVVYECLPCGGRHADRIRHAHPPLEGAQAVETYYYDIRKQVFEYDEVMNNQRRAVYSERRRVLDGRALKKQVIGNSECTMGEIVEAYVNRDLPPEEWDLEQPGMVKEFIYLLEDLTPSRAGLGMEELKASCRSNCACLRPQRRPDRTATPWPMREAERFFFPSADRYAWREHLQAMDALRESVGLRGYGQKDPLIEYKNEVTTCSWR